MTRFALTTLIVSITLPFAAALAQAAAEPDVASTLPPATASIPSFIVAVPSKPGETAPALPRRMWPFLKARVEAVPAVPPAAASVALPFTISALAPAAAPVTPPVPPPPQPRAAMKTPEPGAAAALTIVNGSETPATSITVTGEAKVISHAGPLAPNAKATLKLPKMKGCLVTVAATFEGGSVSDGGAIDVCKVKLVRLID